MQVIAQECALILHEDRSEKASMSVPYAQQQCPFNTITTVIKAKKKTVPSLRKYMLQTPATSAPFFNNSTFIIQIRDLLLI